MATRRAALAAAIRKRCIRLSYGSMVTDLGAAQIARGFGNVKARAPDCNNETSVRFIGVSVWSR